MTEVLCATQVSWQTHDYGEFLGLLGPLMCLLYTDTLFTVLGFMVEDEKFEGRQDAAQLVQ